MSRAIPSHLQTAIITTVPTAEARTPPENAATDARIRAQIKARGAAGFIHYAAARDLTDNSLDARPDGALR